MACGIRGLCATWVGTACTAFERQRTGRYRSAKRSAEREQRRSAKRKRNTERFVCGRGAKRARRSEASF